MRSQGPQASLTALCHAALGFLILAGIKLFARSFDYALDRYVEWCVYMLTADDLGPRQPWKPYDELALPNVPQPALDWNRCALLHNRIVELGWLGHYNGNGRDPSTRSRTTWWETHRAEVEGTAVGARLPRELVEFLKHAQMPEEGLSFTHHLLGLASPGKMFEFLDIFDEGEYMLLLYRSPWIEDDGLGLLFHKLHNLAHYKPVEGIVPDNINWFPLELALGTYLGQIEAGKYVALTPERLGCVDKHDAERAPWAMMPWEMNGGLDRTIQSLSLLTQAIWDRMPVESRTEERRRRFASRMISERSLAGSSVAPQNSFLYQFLTKASGCPFDYIAPGIRCPTDDTIASIITEPPTPPSFSAHSQDPSALPILVFPSDERVSDNVDGGNFYCWWNATLTGVRGGLYLDGPTHHAAYQDGVQLVTPFAVSRNGWARTGDAKEAQDSSAWYLNDETLPARGADAYISLFQLGRNAFVGEHHTQLHVVLDAWRDLVESGLWAVGPGGVEGGMDVFRMADTEEHWWRYCTHPASH